MNRGGVLITGGGGQLACDLAELLSSRGPVSAPTKAVLDIADQAMLDAAMRDQHPAIVLNCAAFHNVEVCEREEDRSFEVNVRAVKQLAQRCAQVGASFVHFSTNYVFDGRDSEPYAETDRPNPESVYAVSKLAGEYMALSYAPRALVVRTAGLYGLRGSASKGGNFVTRVLQRAHAGETIAMVGDQRLAPTFTADLADAVVAALDAGVDGLVHITSSGSCSWFEFTRAIMEVAGLDTEVKEFETTVQPGSAKRPLNGVLAPSGRIQALRTWREALEDYMSRAALPLIA